MGRKKNVHTTEKIDIRLRVESAFHDRVKAVADAEQTTVAAYIRSLVVKDLKRREKEGT